jgi:transketolase
MLACRTKISKGAGRKEGDPNSHGYTLFDDEIAEARQALVWEHEPFVVPEPIETAWRKAGRRAAKAHRKWRARVDAHPDADAFRRALAGDVPPEAWTALDAHIAKMAADRPANATRVHSGAALEVLIPHVPEMIGGSADLTGSNNTRTKGMSPFDAPDYAGRYVHYGVREHGMAAAMNGMALHGGVIPYSGTFLVFSDYSRPAIRLGALMGARVIHVMTHDSIGLGEDGPTHQPVEHLAALRAIPNLLVFRPADAVETAECWRLALEARATPSIMALSRQKTAAVRTDAAENRSARGAYELLPAEDGEARVTLFATGTEVALAVQARALLAAERVPARVVSVPCFELFEQQDPAYQATVIGSAPVRVAVEAAVRQGWDRFIGSDGAFVGMSTFGASAPYERLYAEFGITPEAVAAAAKARL